MHIVTPKNKVSLPVLKAWARVFELLECIYDHPYDRNGFQDAVLHLYGDNKSSKSVFRGMAIPTLRNLGLILGFGDDIRASANGSLLYIAEKAKRSEGLRVLRAILVEFDQEIGVLPYLAQKSAISLEDFTQDWLDKITTSRIRKANTKKTESKAEQRAAHERLLDWVNFLNYAEVLYKSREQLRIDSSKYEDTLSDLDINNPDKKVDFSSLVFNSYRKIVFNQKGINATEIDDLRRETALSMYKKHKLLLTERQFDDLLSELPKTSDKYVITLGRSIGADEKLYVYQGKYYQTLMIRFLDKEEAMHG